MQRGGRAHPVGRGERLRVRDGLALLGRGLARRRLHPPGLGLDLHLLSVRKTEVSSKEDGHMYTHDIEFELLTSPSYFTPSSFFTSPPASFFTSFFAFCLTSSGVVRPVTSACSSCCGPRMGCMPGPVMMLDLLLVVDLEGSAGSHIYMGAPCCCRRAVGRAPHAGALMRAWRGFCVRDLHLAQYVGSLPCGKERRR